MYVKWRFVVRLLLYPNAYAYDDEQITMKRSRARVFHTAVRAQATANVFLAPIGPWSSRS